jgi:hypothetical protein
MADEKLQGITWDEAPAPTEKEPAGITWDKPSVWEAMKQGAKQAFSPEAISEYGSQIPPAAAARMAAPVRLATGMARIPANLMKMAGVEAPAQAVSAAEEGAKNLTESAGYKGMLPGLANLGGEAVFGGAALKGAAKAAPAVEAMGGANLVKGISQSPTAQAILGGMGMGAAGSTGTPYDIAKEAGLGGMFGLGGQTAATALGSVAAPVLKRFNELKDLGYSKAEILKDTTIGQLLGGKTQSLEDILSYIPLSGIPQKIKAGAESLQGAMENKIAPILGRQKAAENILSTSQKQAQTLEHRTLDDAADKATLAMQARHAAEVAGHKATGADVHVPVINYVLEPLGAKITPGLTGHAANNEMKSIISDAYNKSLSGMDSIKLPESTKTEMRDLPRNFDFDLGPHAQSFQADVERLISQTTNGNWLKPDNWQANLSQLSKKANEALSGTGSLADKNYGKALYQLKDKWMDLIEGQVGSDLFKAANTAFSRSKIPEKAASYGKSIKSEGQVEPNELINAIRSELSTSRLAGGEDKIQKMAVEANKKFLADKAAIEARQAAEKLAAKQGNTQQARTLEDKFTGMQSSLAAQKAALQNQAQKQVGAHQAAIGEVAGPSTANKDYAEKRLGYQLGLGGIGGYGLSHYGVDPLTSLALSGGAIAGTRGLYSSPVQNWLKQKALATRPEMVRQAGEALKANAPVAGLTAVQARQRSANEEEPAPVGGLQVPQ